MTVNRAEQGQRCFALVPFSPFATRLLTVTAHRLPAIRRRRARVAHRRRAEYQLVARAARSPGAAGNSSRAARSRGCRPSAMTAAAILRLDRRETHALRAACCSRGDGPAAVRRSTGIPRLSFRLVARLPGIAICVAPVSTQKLHPLAVDRAARHEVARAVALEHDLAGRSHRRARDWDCASRSR